MSLALELDADQHLASLRRWPLLLAALLTITAMIASSLWFFGTYASRVTDGTDLAVAAPPPIEPLELEAVSEETARQLNAAQPFTSRAVPAAAPFRFAGGGIDLARAVDCLASAIYYEAATEPLEGQQAVAQVVLNRVRHPAYPKTVCGVIFQGAERRTGCQFSYTCDGSMRRRPSDVMWQRMRGIAQSMLTGTVFAPVGWATHYHTDWVRPKWSAKLDKITAVRTHLFFRWYGFWGSPNVFRSSNSGGEAAEARLVVLSAVHRTSETLAEAEALAKLLASLPAASASFGDPVFADQAAGQFILTIPTGIDPSNFPAMAEALCSDRDYCKLMAWPQGAATPRAFPVEEGMQATMVFSYLRNRANDFEKPLWNCAVYPRDDKRQCTRKRVVIDGKAQDLIPMNPELVPAPSRTAAAPQEAARRDGLRPINPDTGEAENTPPPVSRTEGRRRPGSGS